MPLLFALALVACSRSKPTLGARATSSASAPSAAQPLASRAEVVAQADQLALAGSRRGGPGGARLTLSAARLRERLWRRERREADALEAIELFRAAGQASWSGACDAELDRALLEGELRNEPAQAYRTVYLLQARARPSACRQRAGRVLATLDAYKPSRAELLKLAQQARASDAGAPDGGTPDMNGPVIVPTLAGAELLKPVGITKVERYGAKDSARIVVYVTHPTTFAVGTLPAENGRGPRLYIDIHRARFHGHRDFDVGGLVERVRLGRHGGDARVVLDLAAKVYRRVFYLPEPFRLIVDVSREPPQELSGSGPRVVRRVVLDPGHGGRDPGAIGPDGLREKDVTLDIAHRAAPLIARELGIATLLTRDADDYVPLDERIARANAFGADLFISIHCNASQNDQSRGVMTFVLDESHDALASYIAGRENSASPAAAAELANVMSHVLDATTLARSTHFAELLQRATMASLAPGYRGVPDRGVKSAGFYVLAGARMPAVLFETSFISNPNGEAYLNTGDYRQKLADAIVNAIRAYRDGK
jgi:N-acetylmuramoyl-L-alanine amidase